VDIEDHAGDRSAKRDAFPSTTQRTGEKEPEVLHLGLRRPDPQLGSIRLSFARSDEGLGSFECGGAPSTRLQENLLAAMPLSGLKEGRARSLGDCGRSLDSDLGRSDPKADLFSGASIGNLGSRFTDAPEEGTCLHRVPCAKSESQKLARDRGSHEVSIAKASAAILFNGDHDLPAVHDGDIHPYWLWSECEDETSHDHDR
jgi:hypothetical protein